MTTLHDSKVKLLQWYREATQDALEAVVEVDTDALEESLTKRDQLIEQMNAYDREAKEVVVSPSVHELLNQIKELDTQLMMRMEEIKTESALKLREIQAGKQLQSKYQEAVDDGDGIFYDTKK